jgi:O-antigen ligase
MLSNRIKSKNINKFLIYFFPISIILGNFVINFVIISCSIIMLISFVKLKDSLFNYLTRNQLIFLILFLIVTLYTTIFVSKSFEISFISWIKLIISVLFSLFISKFLSEENKILNYIKYLVLIILFVAFDGWIQFIFDKNILGFEPVIGHGNRLTGLFGDEAVLGSFLSKLSLIVFFYFYFYKKNIYLALCISIFIICSTLITNERMAFLIVFFSFFNFLLFYVIKKKNYKLLMLIPIILIILAIFIKQNQTIYKQLIVKTDKYFGGISKPMNIIDTPHGVHWVTAYKIFKDNIYIGAGLKNFRLKCSDPVYSTNNKFDRVRCSTHPHNIFFEFISETGILGTTFFIIFIFSVILEKIRNISDPIFFTFSLSIFMYLWPIGTNGSFFSTWNGSFFWLFLGILLAVKKNIHLNKNEY